MQSTGAPMPPPQTGGPTLPAAADVPAHPPCRRRSSCRPCVRVPSLSCTVLQSRLSLLSATRLGPAGNRAALSSVCSSAFLASLISGVACGSDGASGTVRSRCWGGRWWGVVLPATGLARGEDCPRHGDGDHRGRQRAARPDNSGFTGVWGRGVLWALMTACQAHAHSPLSREVAYMESGLGRGKNCRWTALRTGV